MASPILIELENGMGSHKSRVEWNRGKINVP